MCNGALDHRQRLKISSGKYRCFLKINTVAGYKPQMTANVSLRNIRYYVENKKTNNNALLATFHQAV